MLLSPGKKRSASVGTTPSYASSMQEKLQHNASLVQIDKPKKDLSSQNRQSLQHKYTTHSQPHTKSDNSTTTNLSIQKELQIQLENDLPPQLLLQMQMQTLLRPYLQLRPHSPPDFNSPSLSSSSDPSSVPSNSSSSDGHDELKESEQSHSSTEPQENNENDTQQEMATDISDVLQSYSKAYVADQHKVPSLLTRPTPKKTHKEVDLTFHPRIDEKSQKMTASRHLSDNRSRAHILHDMDREITQHKDMMRRNQAEHLMKPYTFAPQLIDSNSKSDREVVDRLHHWYKERDDKIERLRLDNQVLQVTNDMGECTFSPTVLPGYRGYGYPPPASPGVDKFIERQSRARMDKEEKESPYIPGENWTPKLTQPKEFNFMVRERVKEMLHDPTGSSSPSPSPASRSHSHSHSHSLPSSPNSFRRSTRTSRDFSSSHYHNNNHYQQSLSQISPPTSPHSFQSSVSDLDAPLRETDTRTSADFEQLRYYLSDYAVQHPIQTNQAQSSSSLSSSFINDNSSDYTQSSVYNDDDNSDNNSTSILYYNDNDKQFPPSTPNTRSRSNSHNISPQNNSFSQKIPHPLAVSSPNVPTVHTIQEEEGRENEERESDASSIITTQSNKDKYRENEIQKPMPRFQKLTSHLNSNGRPNSAPPSLLNTPENLLRSSGTRKHVAPTSQQRHQQLLQRIQQQQLQQHLQQQQQQIQQQQQLQQQQNTGYDSFFINNNNINQEFHYPLQPQLYSPSPSLSPASPFSQY